MHYRIVAALAFAGALLFAPGVTQAADGAVCYSGFFKMTSTGGAGTTTYPQLGNHHKFNCGWVTTYTIKELSQLGWIIVSSTPVIYSTTTNTDYSITTLTRQMLVIQK